MIDAAKYTAYGRKLGELVLNLPFPRRCPVCDRPVSPFGRLICTECERKLVYIRPPRCMKCGKALREDGMEYCYDCRRRKHSYDRGAALYSYPSVRQTLYRFKYGGRQEYALYLGKDMARVLGKQILSWEPDALLPVPLHSKRFRKRGYNQAALLARQLGKELNLPVEEHLMERVKNTCPQKELEGALRQNNLKKAFKITKNDVKLNTIVIIDDIYTTGSTVDTIAVCLKEAGVKRVCFAAVSIGNGM